MANHNHCIPRAVGLVILQTNPVWFWKSYLGAMNISPVKINSVVERKFESRARVARKYRLDNPINMGVQRPIFPVRYRTATREGNFRLSSLGGGDAVL